ncbi:MAG: hypothetical protein AB7U45_17560 [Desulfamplus sp.]
MKTEIQLCKIIIKLWVFFIGAIATGFYTNQTTISQVYNFFIVFNITVYFCVSLYGIVLFILNVKRTDIPCLCLFAILSGMLIMLLMGIMEIVWYQVDQVLVDWLNLSWSFLELGFAVYVIITLYIINNCSISYCTKCGDKEFYEIFSGK